MACVPERVHAVRDKGMTGVGIEPTTYGLKESTQAAAPSDAGRRREGTTGAATRGTAGRYTGVGATVCPQARRLRPWG